MEKALCDCGPDERTHDEDGWPYCRNHGRDFAACVFCGEIADVIDGEPMCGIHAAEPTSRMPPLRAGRHPAIKAVA